MFSSPRLPHCISIQLALKFPLFFAPDFNPHWKIYKACIGSIVESSENITESVNPNELSQHLDDGEHFAGGAPGDVLQLLLDIAAPSPTPLLLYYNPYVAAL